MAHPRRILISAGPTQEPIDSVRFIGNRSSGRLGVAFAEEAQRAGWEVTLLLGPTAIEPGSGVRIRHFRTTADLELLLGEEFPKCDVLVMAAAVADYRPVSGGDSGKIRRSEGRLTLELESTPDLLAWCARLRRSGQVIIGFALEPRDRMMESARSKIERKGIDAIVANPLETMDATDIEATLIWRDGRSESTKGAISKAEFAGWLMERIELM